MKLALLYEHAFLDGGYPRDVRWLAGALSRAGVKVSIFGRVTASPKTDGLDTAIDLSSWQSLPLHLKRFDLVHIFGLFSMNHPLLAGACATRGMPLVISPLSHLLPLPMQMKRRKKALFLKMAWGPWIRRMTFHVFSRVEAKSVLNWVPDARLFEASMGIFPAADQSIPHPSSPESGNQPRSFLFFGRNDIYQKGLDSGPMHAI
jgi:hypothetical protein